MIKKYIYLSLLIILTGCDGDTPKVETPVFDVIPDTIERDLLIIKLSDTLNNKIGNAIFDNPNQYKITEYTADSTLDSFSIVRIEGPKTCTNEDCLMALYRLGEDNHPQFYDIFSGRDLQFSQPEEGEHISFTVKAGPFIQTWARVNDEYLGDRYDIISKQFIEPEAKPQP